VDRRRNPLTDTVAMLLAVVVHLASVQDRDSAEALPRKAVNAFPSVERIIGDVGYQGLKAAAAVVRTGTLTMENANRCDRHRFVVLPKR
jgi:type VI protein secretion system component VasF